MPRVNTNENNGSEDMSETTTDNETTYTVTLTADESKMLKELLSASSALFGTSLSNFELAATFHGLFMKTMYPKRQEQAND